MQFLNTAYLAAKHSRPLIQNYRIGVSNDIPNCLQREIFKAFSTQSTDERKTALNTQIKPSKPLSIYLRYVKLIEPKIVQEHPDAKKTEISKIAKEMFKSLDEGMLSSLEKQYSIEVEQYKKDMQAYKAKLAHEQESVLTSIPAKPKKPLSTFLRYIKLIEPKLIQQNPKAKRTEIVKVASEMFKTADTETLLRLQKEYFEELESYKKELAAYDSNLTNEQKEALDDLRSIKKKNKLRRQSRKELKETNKPKKPPNAYLLFIQKRKAEARSIGNLTEWITKMGSEWKSLSEQEKNKYVDEAERLHKQYETEISKWEASLENTKFSHLLQKPQKKSESTKSKSNLPKKTEMNNSDSVSVENVIYSHSKADSKNNETANFNISSRNEYNVQSCHSTLRDKCVKIDSELKHTTDRYSINEMIVRLRKNNFPKIVFLIDSCVSDKRTVNIVIGVTFVSVFIVLPFFYFFC